MKIAKGLLKSNITIRIKTQGSSMLPFIRAGDYIVIKHTRYNEVGIGDIIAYSYNGQDAIICHRLVKIKGPFLIAKGDTHIRGNERILSDSFLGKVISVERGKNKINTETRFQRFLSYKIARVSLNFPVLLFITAYFVEALRTPHLVPIKLYRIVRQYRTLFQWPM